ncbi:MAG: GNAT family N-acetyltransferase [[Clostridium] fimetarium]|nr:GNAT family N-acetyltransferase [Alistipes timonensis]MCM1405372.1 GNAT family N-acetyltransferase [[Clostridium] fimetarium]
MNCVKRQSLIMRIREYRDADLMEIVALFHQTVHRINIRDYTLQQVNAWAPDNIDIDAWRESLAAHNTFVAIDGDTIIGFGDIDDSGYLDRLYVHHAYQGRGVATALCDRLETSVRAERITVHASVTALPFFLRRGYRVVKERLVERRGVTLKNYAMERLLAPDENQ